MKLSENADEIIIRHIPVREWVIGGILIFTAGVFCLWLLFAAFIKSRGLPESFFSNLFASAPGLIIAAAFVLLLFKIGTIRSPLIIITVSQKTESVDILQRRFYGDEMKRFYFTQINKFKSYKGAVNFSPKYFLALVLANQKTIKLKIPVGGDKQNTIKLVKKLNKFVKSKRLSEEHISSKLG